MLTDTPPSHPFGKTVDSFLRPEALKYSINQQRHHIDQLIRQGHISLSEGTILTVGPDLMIHADGMEPLTPRMLATQAPSFHMGPNTNLSSPTPSDTSTAKSVVAEGGSELPTDSEHYESLLEAWAQVPEEAHWAWHHGLKQLKNLGEGNRHEDTLRKLIRTARAEEDKDLLFLHKHLSMAPILQRSTDEDLYVNLQLAFGRVLGIEPPSGSPPNDLWADHFLFPAFQKSSYLGSTITELFSLIHTINSQLSSSYKQYQYRDLEHVCSMLRSELAKRESGLWLRRLHDFI